MDWGQPAREGFTFVNGKTYDLSLNAQTKDLALAQKNGEVILSLQAGKTSSAIPSTATTCST